MNAITQHKIESNNKYVEEIRHQQKDALDYFETHQKLGDTTGAWFHYGMALAFQEALIILGDSDGSDFPGPDPIELAMEAPKDERVEYVHLIQEALGDMGFWDEVPNEVYEELRRYGEYWNKRVEEEGR